MKITDIIDIAFTETYYDKVNDKMITIKTDYRYDPCDNIIYVYKQIEPYKLLVLRKLLKVANREINNIIVGNPFI